MKSLFQYTNVDKASQLHQFFPEEIPALIEFISGMAEAIQQNEQRNREHWDNGFMSFDYWLSLITDTQKIIKRQGNNLVKSRKVFSEQLFSGYTAHFVNHCITVYTSTIKHPNPKFALAVELLYYP